ATTASGDAGHSEGINEQRRASSASILAELTLLVLSTPVVLVLCELLGLPLVVAGLWSVIQMAVVVWLVNGHVQEWAQARMYVTEAKRLGHRAALAEATVRREQERLHELRTAVSGIGMTHRLLREREADLPAPARSRLEGLYESELVRLEHLVDD